MDLEEDIKESENDIATILLENEIHLPNETLPEDIILQDNEGDNLALDTEIPSNLADIPKISNDEDDPLEGNINSFDDEKTIDDVNTLNEAKKLKPNILTTNSAKFEYAQMIVKEVMKRAPIFTDNEEEEKKVADKLRIRMMRIKNRILNDIKLPLEAQEEAREKAKIKRNHKYKRMIEKETPEEAAQRRKREAEAKCYHRNIQKELETPEVLFERRMEKLQKRLERKANETPEERAARKEQTRNYRLMLKARRTEKDALPKPKEMVCAKTGIVYDRSTRKRKNKRNDSAKVENVNIVNLFQCEQNGISMDLNTIGHDHDEIANLPVME